MRRFRGFSPSCRRGSGGVRQQAGLDGLGSVPRLLLEPSSPHRSSQPAHTYSRFVAVRTYGSKGLKIQYAGISTPFVGSTFHCRSREHSTLLLAHLCLKSSSDGVSPP